MEKISPYLPCRFFLLNMAMAFFMMCIASCHKLDVYEKNTVMPVYAWSWSFKPEYNFEITDTVSSYNMMVVLRHTDAYAYNNIWINIGTKFPGDSMRYQRFDLQLGSDAHGWEGNGMDDIWELRKPITNGPVKFKKTGVYTFSLAQIMRQNPLEHVVSAGIRVEKVR